MDIDKLKKNFNTLEKKYFYNKKSVSDYYNEIMDNVDDYINETNDYNALNYFKEIVSGEDMEGLMNYSEPNSLYYWKSYDEVYNVDYEMLKNLSRKTITEIEKNKENTFELC